MTIAPQLMTSARTNTGRDDWQTPECVLERVRRVGPIDIDPCTSADNPAGAARYYTPSHDGLAQSWYAPGGIAYVNPPYSRCLDWIAKCAAEAERGCQIIALVPARTDTRWWQHCWTADAICFWRGRLKFVGAPASAPFPSAIVYWGREPEKFEAAFGDAGKVVRL